MPRRWKNTHQLGGAQTLKALEDSLHAEWERWRTQRRVDQLRRDMRRRDE